MTSYRNPKNVRQAETAQPKRGEGSSCVVATSRHVDRLRLLNEIAIRMWQFRGDILLCGWEVRHQNRLHQVVVFARVKATCPMQSNTARTHSKPGSRFWVIEVDGWEALVGASFVRKTAPNELALESLLDSILGFNFWRVRKGFIAIGEKRIAKALRALRLKCSR